MKIFVDDLRNFEEAIRCNYSCFRSYEQCILILSITKNVDVINLDYDLGSDKTGLDILKYINKNRIHVNEIIIHSTHKEGVREMELFIKEYFTDVKYTYCPYSEWNYKEINN